MMESVKIIECPRDAWQGLKRQIPTERKIEYLRGLITAGFRHIDAVSFVSPKAVPQMADSEKVLKQLGPLKNVEIIGIVVNEQGAERAIATGGVSTLGYPYSISETFLRRNQNQSPEENEAVLKRIKDRADEAGLAMVAYISMAFGNPYGDPWSDKKVVEKATTIASLGIGAAIFVITPILALVVFIAGIFLGFWWLGLLLIPLWILLLAIGYVVSGFLLGRLIFAQLGWGRYHDALALLAGLVVLAVVGIIPVIGWLVGLVALLLGAGALALVVTQRVRMRPAPG